MLLLFIENHVVIISSVYMSSYICVTDDRRHTNTIAELCDAIAELGYKLAGCVHCAGELHGDGDNGITALTAVIPR